MKKGLYFIIVVIVLAVTGIVMLGNRANDPATESMEESSHQSESLKNELFAATQSPGREVSIREVHLTQNAYVVIHKEADGKPGKVVGTSLSLLPGENHWVRIALTEDLKDGERIFAMLHSDDGNGVYEFPGGDAPLKDETGAIVMIELLVKKADISPVTENSKAKVFAVEGTNFAFSQKEIRVKKGDTVRINLTSKDGFHDFVIDEFNAATDGVQTGESVSVEFVADKAGSFEYYCSIGSHRQLGMKGALIVE